MMIDDSTTKNTHLLDREFSVICRCGLFATLCVCVWIGNGSHCVCMYCIGLMVSFVHRVTDLNVRQLSLASVMTLIVNCSQNLIC